MLEFSGYSSLLTFLWKKSIVCAKTTFVIAVGKLALLKKRYGNVRYQLCILLDVTSLGSFDHSLA